MDEMEHLAAAAVANGGYLLTRHLRNLGIGSDRIAILMRAKHLTKIRYGAYAPTKAWSALDPVQRYAAVVRSVLDRADDGAVASHQSAAALHGLDLWHVPLDVVHLTRLDGRAGRHRAGVVWHEPTITDDDVTIVDGRACTSPVRAALETASITGVRKVSWCSARLFARRAWTQTRSRVTSRASGRGSAPRRCG